MSKLHLFFTSSAIWILMFFVFGLFLGDWQSALAIAGVSYIIPFGGMFFSYMLAYEA